MGKTSIFLLFTFSKFFIILHISKHYNSTIILFYTVFNNLYILNCLLYCIATLTYKAMKERSFQIIFDLAGKSRKSLQLLFFN